MPKISQQDALVESPLGAGRVGALVGLAEALGSLAAILEEQGFDIACFEHPNEIDFEQPPGFVVLRLEGTLSSARSSLAELRNAVGELPVVIVCDGIRPGELRPVLAAGATGVVFAEEVRLALAPSLVAALASQVCVPKQVMSQIEPAPLSPREKQILGLVAMGFMNVQIAEQLFVAESTVKSHLSSAFGKLGVRSRGEAVDLILDPERGLGMGILAIGGEPIETAPGPQA